MTTLSSTQIHILRHSLGVPSHGDKVIYRNHFCTGPGSLDWDDCLTLTDYGYMTKQTGNAITGGDYVFFVTEAGQSVVESLLEQEKSK